MNRIESILVPNKLAFELFILGSMFITLLLPSELSPVTVWSELSFFHHLRAIVWILGLMIIPGADFLSLARIADRLSKLEIIVIGLNLSFVLVGLATLVLCYVQSIMMLPWFILSVLVILRGVIQWLKPPNHQLNVRLKVSKPNYLLIIGITIAILAAFFVAFAQRYLVPGDVWVSLNPAVQIVNERNVYETFAGQYPILFGFILGGLSICCGLSVVNTYVYLFPLVALNILSFFVLMKTVFNQDDNVATLASILYGFGGGLAWLIQTIVYNGTSSFWSLSYLTHDVFFALPLWNDIMFSYKSLALTLAYTSLVLFILTLRFKDIARKLTMFSLCSLFIIFSFLIHMLELVIILPMILALAYVYQKGMKRYISLGIILFFTIIIAYIVDSLMSGFSFWLISAKVQLFLATFGTNTFNFYLLLSFGATFLLILGIRVMHKHFARLYFCRDYLHLLKIAFIIGISVIYSCGLLFWAPSSLELSSPFPWYLYCTRYGFLGLLAIIGIGIIKWKAKFFILSSFWSAIILVLGSLWWGSRINSYLFPMISLYAAIAICWIWKKSNSFPHIILTTAKFSVKKSFKMRLKTLVIALIIICVLLSFTSVIYSIFHYVFTGPSISDDEARAISWINQNTSENVTILVPNIYAIHKGVSTIGDREIYLNNLLPKIDDAISFINLTQTLSSHNLRYLINIDNAKRTATENFLLSCSTIVFQSGTTKVFRIPILSPPSSIDYTVTVVHRELLGFYGDTSDLGWIDDSFMDNWFTSNIETNSDGEILTFRYEFQANTDEEPLMKKYFSSPINTNMYPYLIVRYRNTYETSATPDENLAQIVTLVNETGYPAGFIKNFYLPRSNGESFQLFTAELPANQSIAETWIWMRNYENQNATVNLEIDYIGFVSATSIPDQNIDTQLLPLVLASLWPTNYSISSNFNEVNNSFIVVSTYDNNVWTCIEKSTDINTFVFFNSTATFPPLGTRWRTINTGIISGYFNGKRIIIVGTESLNNQDIFNTAQLIYEEIES